ncbi:efflux RND transporter permease subunit [Lacibacterium aquatile]|uniref:Efflux RND transporter permease subunit n=1 Tax=Lacibacterium aquatile TaxID=1168082 RepID=A0ABW5DW32_9PROT
MSITELCIRRPVFATVLNILVVLLGAVSYQNLSLREYPNIDTPTVTVETAYRGASAEIIESQVTKPLEENLSGVEGIDYMKSISRAERSQITLTFRLTRSADDAASDVRDRVGRSRGQMPDEIDEPIIQKVEADAQPIIYLAFSSDRHSVMEVSDFASRLVKDRLQVLPGVAQVQVFGERRYSMRVWVDAAKLSGYGLTVQDVETSLRKQNVEIPAGRIESRAREFTVVSETDLRTPEQFASIILKDSGGYLVRLGDIAQIAIGPRDERVVTRFNGNTAIALGVIKQSTANPLEVSQAVEAAFPEIKAQVPEGMSVTMAYDSSIFIAKSIDAVYSTIGEAVALVVLVILFFLRSFRAALIPLITIPVSLIGAFAIMSALGFTINTLTLLALVLAIGLVVDDAIVMLENIYRYIEEGMNPVTAAIKGSKEITFAVIAMTVTLAAVYAPMAFSSGLTGKLFTEFALTLAGAVIVSGFIALTLTPMMCSRLLKHSDKHNFVYNGIGAFLDYLDRAYRWGVTWSVRGRWVSVALGLFVGMCTWLMFTTIKSELSPTEDRGFIIGFMLAPEGSTIGYTESNARGVEGILRNVPETDKVFMVAGFPTVSQSLIFASMKDWEQRDRKVTQIVPQISPQMFGGVPGLLAFPILPPSLGQQGLNRPIDVVIMTSGAYETLAVTSQAVIGKMMQSGMFANPRSDLELTKPKLAVQVDRDKAGILGVDIEAIGRTLETMLGGRQVTRFKRDAEQYDVMVQVAQDARRNPTDLTHIYVRARSGDMVPLSNLVKVTETIAPKELNHFNKLRAVNITAEPAPGYTQGQALDAISRIIREVQPDAITDFGGSSREYVASAKAGNFVFVLAIAFILLVLAAQFESFIDPLAILLTVPLAMAGALGALLMTGGTMNVYSQIGLVTLVGLITKHGILIVEFTKQLQERGMALKEAVIESAALRLRPILMTTGAMVLGAVPLALATGAGAESRQQIGWVIVGGMSVGTLLTLFVLPAIYTLVAKERGVHAKAPEAPPVHAPAE